MVHLTAGSESTKSLPGGGSVSTRSKGGYLHVSINGEFRLGWLGGFSRALSRRKIDIVSLTANLNENGQWHAELELTSSAGSLAILDVAALLGENDIESSKRADVRLEHASLTREPSGALILHVAAPDELGFLAQLLSRLGFLGAFPERIVARSEAGRLTDSFWLRSFGRAPISEKSELAIAQAFSIPSGGKKSSNPPPSFRLEAR